MAAAREYKISIDIDTSRYEKSLEDFQRRMVELAEEASIKIYEGEFEMAKKKARSPFTTGKVTTKPTGDGQAFLSLKDGDTIQMAPLVGLDQMVSADMHEYWNIKPAIYHPCIGARKCPGEAVENEPRFKGYLPVLVKDQGVMIYPFTISVYKQLEQLENALDDGETLAGFVLRVSRTGTGLATRYTVLGIGKRIDISDSEVPDFIDRLGPQTLEEIWELLEKNGYDREDTEAEPTVAKPPKDDEVEEDEKSDEKSDDKDDDDWGEV